jgi:hypothetical protein
MKKYHKYRHFAKNCPKSSSESPTEEAYQWKIPKKKKKSKQGTNHAKSPPAT